MLNNLVIIALVLVILTRHLRRDLASGLAVAAFCLVLVPIEVRVPLPGALPQITVHRMILVVCAIYVFRLQSRSPLSDPVPAVRLFVAILFARGISTLVGTEPVGAVKDWLSFLLESLLFYVVIAYGLRDWATVRKVLAGAVYGLLIVAFIAVYEKYRGDNLASRIVPWKGNDPLVVDATFRHRILLGYAMSMGFPLAVLMVRLAASKWRLCLAWASVVLLPAACYFSSSRGPWAGLAGGGMVMALLAPPKMRKTLALVGVMALVGLLSHPGIVETVKSRWSQTKSTDTLKGRSASYRLVLWEVALNQLSKSPVRLLFGYGGGSLETMNLGDQFEFGGGAGQLGFTSWDSEMAADFMKYGFVGFGLELLLLFFVVGLGLSAWLRAPPEFREILAACLGTAVIFLWAMTNVAIFNPQLTYLFWIVVAVMARARYLGWSEQEWREVPGASNEDAPEAVEGVTYPSGWPGFRTFQASSGR